MGEAGEETGNTEANYLAQGQTAGSSGRRTWGLLFLVHFPRQSIRPQSTVYIESSFSSVKFPLH